jgi:hypothetical protein
MGPVGRRDPSLAASTVGSVVVPIRRLGAVRVPVIERDDVQRELVMAEPKHVHVWGTLCRDASGRVISYCINGWCPMARHKSNGRVFLARPERWKAPRAR